MKCPHKKVKIIEVWEIGKKTRVTKTICDRCETSLPWVKRELNGWLRRVVAEEVA